MANEFITREEFFKAVGGTTKERAFILPRKTNKDAAAHRYSVTSKMFEEWFDEINSEKCNTRDMPYDLVMLYEKACEIILKIMALEEEIVIDHRS